MRPTLFHLLVQSLLLSLILLVCANATTIPRSRRVLTNLATQFEAIYQFGDSLSDTGNYVREGDGANSAYNKLPYGQTINHPTGRASDGLIMVDYIATYFHLPQLNPYLATGSDFTHGANFAVIGAAANGGFNSLAKQLDWFKTHLTSTFPNPAAIKERLQKSLVLMGEIGGNDFNGPFGEHQTIQEVSKLVPGVVKTIKDSIEEVIGLGATNIVVPGNFPIGCVPLYLVLFATNDTSKYDELNCLKEYNDFSKFYNQQLLQAIQQLQQEHPDVAIVYADYYAALTSVISNPLKLGIEKNGTEKACCGTGDNPYNYGGKSCGSPGSVVCPDPSKRVNWDGVHMTQQGNKGVADQLLKQFVPALEKQLLRRRRKNH
ncbi:GDSL esterase/lipase At1g31550-like [Spinacia oleracea]|uniref:GDSL esterase/lipase At1g31550-like n=1 Tax=Spinacia oleracea TaxID=3562 RepID=A0A9R0I9X7_SPIOL|nr:GDSL esterase/lipase At1g31550-like [Spinacia oleracea]